MINLFFTQENVWFVCKCNLIMYCLTMVLDLMYCLIIYFACVGISGINDFMYFRGKIMFISFVVYLHLHWVFFFIRFNFFVFKRRQSHCCYQPHSHTEMSGPILNGLLLYWWSIHLPVRLAQPIFRPFIFYLLTI